MKVRVDRGQFALFCNRYGHVQTITSFTEEGKHIEMRIDFAEGNRMVAKPDGFFMDVKLIGTEDFKQSAKALMKRNGIIVNSTYLRFAES